MGPITYPPRALVSIRKVGVTNSYSPGLLWGLRSTQRVKYSAWQKCPAKASIFPSHGTQAAGEEARCHRAPSCLRPDIAQQLLLFQGPGFWPPGVIGKLLLQAPGGAESEEEKLTFWNRVSQWGGLTGRFLKASLPSPTLYFSRSKCFPLFSVPEHSFVPPPFE